MSAPLAKVFTSSSRSKPARRIAELAQRRAELVAQQRDLAGRLDAAEQERRTAQEQLDDAEARHLALGGLEAEVKRARRRAKAAEDAPTVVEPELPKVRGAVAALDAEIANVVARHADELTAEVGEDGVAAADRLRRLLWELGDAREAYRREWVRSTELSRAVDPDSLRLTRIPDLPDDINRVAKAAPALAETVRAPVPVQRPAGWSIPETDSPDDEVRERARSEARIREARLDGGAAA